MGYDFCVRTRLENPDIIRITPSGLGASTHKASLYHCINNHLCRSVGVVLSLSGAVVLIDVDGLPGVADPDIADSASGCVVMVHHVEGKSALLLFVLVL